MKPDPSETLRVEHPLVLEQATLVLAFSGWMDGGDVSTGTVRRLVDLLEARVVAEIDPEPFYLYHFPGPMELAALFRPHVKIEAGRVQSLDMPANKFYAHDAGRLILFLGKEPNLHWRAFGDAILALADKVGVRRVLFVGS